MSKVAKLKPEAVVGLFGSAFFAELKAEVPKALTQAGLPAAMVQPYMDKVIPILANNLAVTIGKNFLSQGIVLGLSDSSPLFPQIMASNPGMFNGSLKPVNDVPAKDAVKADTPSLDSEIQG